MFQSDPWPTVALAGICGTVVVQVVRTVVGGFFGLFTSDTITYCDCSGDGEAEADEEEDDEEE